MKERRRGKVTILRGKKDMRTEGEGVVQWGVLGLRGKNAGERVSAVTCRHTCTHAHTYTRK